MTDVLPPPAAVRRALLARLPGAYVVVVPRGRDLKRCPAWQADLYELAVFRPDMGADLAPLAAAVAGHPGVYLTTVLRGGVPDDPAWPVRYRSADTLRPQVRALIR